MKNLKNKLFIIFSLLCALALTSCMDLYDGHEVPTTYKVTFEGNGGATSEGLSSYNQFIDVGKEANLRKASFVRENYSFVGWSLDEKATTTKYVDEEKVTLTSDITLYARWQTTVCTVTFYSNDGTDNKATQKVGINEPTKLKENAFSREGFIFDGWSLDESASTTTYIDKQTVTLTNDLALWARWLPATSKITFDGNGGSVNGAGVVFSYTREMTTNVPTALEKNTFRKTGQLFKGWALSDSATEIVYSDGSTYTPAGDVTLYAIWADVKANYTISYKNVDGTDFADWTLGYTAPSSYTVDIDPASATYGKVTTTVTLPTISNISRTDKFFAGWYSTNTYSGNAWTEVSGFASGDLTFYPKWSEVGLYVAGSGHSSATGDGSDVTGTGSSTAPFASLDKAVKSVQESENLDWVIFIDGDVKGKTEIATVNVKSLKIKGVSGHNSDILDGNNLGSTISVLGDTKNLIFENITIKNGKGTTEEGTDTLGGGIYIKNVNAKVTLSTGAVVTANATTKGAGVYVNAGELIIDGGAITGNTATESGGGVYNAGGTVTMKSGSITSNKANGTLTTNGGGGIYNGNIFVMSGGEIASNKAQSSGTSGNKANGGGVYNANIMKIYGDAVIGDRSAPPPVSPGYSNFAMLGGGIYNAGTLHMGFEGNSLTGGLYYNRAAAGGGLYIADNAVTNINSGMILRNIVTDTENNKAGIQGDPTFKYDSTSEQIQTD